MTFDAVLLCSFGGPSGPDEVMPFLERVTAGRGVPRDRLEEVSQHYLAVGGVSPINAQNRMLLRCLREAMDGRGIDVPLYWGNRNSAPYLADAVREIHAAGRRRVLAIATSAYSSYSGCRQYRENLAQALAEAGLAGEVEIAKAQPYCARPGFVAPFAEGLAVALEGVTDSSGVRILFTTHSIPLSMAQSSGPEEHGPGTPGLYERQHLVVAQQVMAAAMAATGPGDIEWRLVYQSRSGPGQVPWLEPDIGDAIRDASVDGKQTVIAVPIGFVSDHMEVVWDLDHEAQEIANSVGVDFIRVATPGTDARFVNALVDVISEALSAAAEQAPGSLCSDTCCRNSRADLPVVPGR